MHSLLPAFLLSLTTFCFAIQPPTPEPAALQGIRLTDQQGRPVLPASFGTGPVLMNFIFTRCAAACPMQTRELAAVWRALPSDVREKVQFLSVSVDPAADTPAKLAAFAKLHGAADAPGWRFAAGDIAEVKRLLQRLRVFDPSKADPQPSDHRLELYLFDRSGMPVIKYSGQPVDQPRLVEELTQLTRLGR